MESTYSYIVKIIRYVLCGQAFELGADTDFQRIYECSKRHGIENIVYVGLKDLNAPVPCEIMAKLEEEYQKAIMTEAVQAIELENLSSQFDEAGIDHIPLKGSVIKYLYPMPDFRKSGDIDILIKPADEKTAMDIIAGDGYSLIEDGDAHDIHISCFKPPMMLIEIHRALVRNKNRAYGFCSGVWENVSLCEGTKHRYKMSDEFLYVYLLAHLSKHISTGGAGIRLIADMYFANNKLDLDSDKLNLFLEKAQLTDINKMVLKLTARWFDGVYENDASTDILENLVLTGGSFGNTETKKIIDGNISKRKRISRFFKMIFPSKTSLLGKYPVLKRHGFLLPLVWIHRAFILLLFKRNSVMADIKENFDVQDIDNEYSELFKAVCDQ